MGVQIIRNNNIVTLVLKQGEKRMYNCIYLSE